MSTLYSVGQMNQLGDALESAGFTTEDVTKLRTSPRLRDIKQVLLGNAEIAITKHFINLNADPFVPKEWKVEKHQKGGTFEWNPGKVILWQSSLQSGYGLGGEMLLEQMSREAKFNACLLDFLLANPHLIPETWKGKDIYFWGTIYRHPFCKCVRFLTWKGNSWQWLAHSIKERHYMDSFAAVEQLRCA